MNAIENSPFFWLALIGILGFVSALPTLIAIARGADDISYIILLNVICCATVFGWPIALITAIRWPRRYPRPSSATHRYPPPSAGRHRQLAHRRGPYA
jgi:Superinfection immunity protein